MPSFLDDENEMIVGAVLQEIADQVLEDWINNNLDEGEMYSDWRIAQLSDEPYIKAQFNRYYKLSENDDYYL